MTDLFVSLVFMPPLSRDKDFLFLMPGFHISTLRSLYLTESIRDMDGNLWATYVHTLFLNVPHMAFRFVSACVEMKERHANESMKANSSRKLEKKENV